MSENGRSLGAYYTRGLSCDSGNYKRRFERAKRARAAKREKVHRALREAGFICIDGVWVAGVSALQAESFPRA